MAITRIHDGLYQAAGVCNTWLIVRGDAAIAIDPGDGRWLDELDHIGVKHIEWMLLTHTHREHCSGVYRLDRDVTKIAVPATERHLVEDVESFWRTRQVHINYNQVDNFAALPRNVAVDKVLIDYETFTWRDVALKIVPAPGQSPGAIALIGDGHAFVGDMIQAPACVPRIDRLQYGYGDVTGAILLIHSLHHLTTHNPERLFPSSGEIIDNPRIACAQLSEKLRTFCHELGYDAPVEPQPDFIELNDNLLAFTKSSCAWYVVHDGSGNALAIDVGYSAGEMYLPSTFGYTTRFFPGAIETLRNKYGIERLEAVIPTHYHDDHVIGIPYLHQHHHTKVWCYDRIAPILREPTRFNMPCLINTPIHVDRTFVDRESFEWRGIHLQMHDIPGQTDLHSGISFDLAGKRYLAMGDSGHIRNDRHVHGDIIFANRVTGENHLKVAHRMIEIAPDVLLHGHNRRTVDGVPRPDTPVTGQDLQDYLDSARRLDQTLKAMVVDEPGRRCRADWVRIEPYRIRLEPGESVNVELIAENQSDYETDLELSIIAPEGLTIEPIATSARVEVDGIHRSTHQITKSNATGPSPAIICVNVTMNGRPMGWLGHSQVWHEGVPR